MGLTTLAGSMGDKGDELPYNGPGCLCRFFFFFSGSNVMEGFVSSSLSLVTYQQAQSHYTLNRCSCGITKETVQETL